MSSGLASVDYGQRPNVADWDSGMSANCSVGSNCLLVGVVDVPW